MHYYKHIITTLLMTFTLTLTACGEGYQFPCDIWGGCPDEKSSSPPDMDGDGIADASDNCPTVANPDQSNAITPENPLGDACDDPDRDGITDAEDNCPAVANRDQQNLDGDDQGGDACDALTPIGTVAQLSALSVGTYLITADLTVTSTWTPNDFSGTLNGDNHLIRGLSSRPLFDVMGASASVTNLGIIGGTLAHSNHGVISNAYTTGNSDISTSINDRHRRGRRISCGDFVSSQVFYTIIGRSGYCFRYGRRDGTDRFSISYSGGLVGANFGTIRNSYAIGDSRSASIATGIRDSTNFYSYSFSGGLVGMNSGSISQSYAIGDARSETNGCCQLSSRSSTTASSNGYSGGLVGYNRGSISNSYATGNTVVRYTGGCCTTSASRTLPEGGLVGHNAGHISNSYATGNTGYSYVSVNDPTGGGLVGVSRRTITNSYRVQTSGSTHGTAITLPNLRTATASSTGWSDRIWTFGSSSQLPTLADVPACPGGGTSCRW